MKKHLILLLMALTAVFFFHNCTDTELCDGDTASHPHLSAVTFDYVAFNQCKTDAHRICDMYDPRNHRIRAEHISS